MKAYAAYHRDEDVVKQSSSGGAYTALSDTILEMGGIVVGSKYDYKKNAPVCVVAQTKKERDEMRGSMYIQSFISPEIYTTIANRLKESFPVLFVGTACQCNAINRFMKSVAVDCTNLILCDILCHGVGSPGIWNKYIEEKEKLLGDVSYISFKDKRNGWLNPLCVGKSECKEFSLREYSWLYFSDCIMRPSCYECKYASTNRGTDITIGDFWKVKKYYRDFYHPSGTSMVITTTSKGEAFFQKARESMVIFEVEIDNVLQNNMIRPTLMGKYRTQIMKDYDRLSRNRFFFKWKCIFFLKKVYKMLMSKTKKGEL